MLETLARQRDGATLSDLSRTLASPKSSLLSLLRAMTRHGYLQHSVGGAYRLGPASVAFAAAALATRDLPELARPLLEELAERSGETALLGVLARGGSAAVYVDKVESSNLIRYTVPLGEPRPLYCTAIGKLLLAHLDDARLEAWLRSARLPRLAPRTITDRTLLREALQRIRAAGLAVSVDEVGAGAAGIAAPVRDHEGRVVAGVTLAGPSSRVTRRRRELVDLVKTQAQRLSRLLGARESADGRRIPPN